jgi:hypothetical protein
VSLILPKLTAFLFILVLAVPMFLAPSTRAPVASAAHTGDITSANDAVASKIHPKLRAAVAVAALTDDFDVIVYAEAGADLSRYMSNMLVAKYIWPNGTQTYYGRIKAANIAKLASLPAVAAIQDLRYQGDLPQIPDMGERRLNAYDPTTVRATVAALQAKKGTIAPKAPAGQATVADWFDVRDVHKSKAAWDLGYTGQGVKVLVNDTGSDFSHPDLIGTIARIDDPGSPYNGWPEMFDSFSMLNLAYDYFYGTKYIKSGVGIYGYAPDYADTSTTRSGGELTALGDGTYVAEFAPIHSADPAGHTYKLPGASKSGVYHFGSHPDTMLEAFYDERVAVLVVDEHVPGVYDTVYVDLDDDYDFTNNRKSVKGDEYVYMDLDVDGYPDISGGIIYWISDGAHSLPASDWLYGIGPNVAGPGNLVAFSINDISEGGGDHGTLCASGVAGQGVIDGGAPPYKPAGDGTPGTGMSVGGGRNVKLSSNGSGYTVGNALNEGVLFAALGYDGLPKTADDMQIVSDSWGDSGVVNDGWDYNSRLFDFILRFVNPYLSEGNSTGNGGSGYGTTNSPGANLSIAVGASTLYDSDGVSFDSIAGQGQILYNDSMSFSDRGPSAQGEVGVSVLANGAWGAGAIPLNEAMASGHDGWNAWENWGGTSRSTPVALGNLALAMQAFRQKNGRWPTNVEARSILMAGADTAWNDGFVEGSGVVNALRSVQIAAGLGGVNVFPDSLTFGDYRGTKYDAFTSIMYPGKSNTQTFRVSNAGPAPVNLAITDDRFVRFAEKTIDFTTVDQKLETANTRMPDYLIDVKNLIPAGTTMMEAILVQPFEEFDPNFDYNANSSWRILPTDWTDVNGDGKLYEDKNGNGAINCPVAYGIPNWSATACEIQGGEYMRFGYGYDRGTTMQQRVRMPLERKHDGVFIALQHRSKSVAVPVTHLKIQLNFYRTEDMPWLTTPAALTVPAGGTATFDATMAVPATANVGLYEATIRIDDGANVTNVPVVANVAAYSIDFLFGGPPETKTPYENGMVGGYFSWTEGAESGDWRFFFMDAPDTTPKGTYLLVDNRWSGAKNDIDTVIMGPTQDCFSNGVGCGYPSSTRFPGAKPVYGPYALAPVGGSDRLNPRAGVWLQQTSTGGPREIVSAPVKAGLNLVALHNNLFEGRRWAETFQAQVGVISATPDPVELFVDSRTSGTFPVTVKSSLPLPDLQVAAFGLGVPDIRTLSEIQDNPNNPSSASYQFRITAKDAAYIEVNTEAAAGDSDLYLLYDTNGDDNFDFSNEVIASSTTSTGNEHVKVTFPADGNYRVAVHGWGIEPGAKFTIEMNVVQGGDLRVGNLPAGPYPPNTPIPFQANWSLDAPLDVDGEAFGVIVLGPSGAESAIEIPVRLHNVIGSSETMTLTVSEDARIFSGAATTNFGQDKYLYAGANDTSRSVMRFDMSGINPAYGIESAKLRVYVDAFGGGSQADLAAYPLAKDFAESSVTWNTPWATTGGDFTNPPVTAPITKANVGQFIEFDVTPWVQTWFNSPGTNHGVLLRLINQTTYTSYRFVSGEYWDTGKLPALIVTVTKP